MSCIHQILQPIAAIAIDFVVKCIHWRTPVIVM
jgi:hypothetical protein